MKTRSGFVTNSSSSSYILVSTVINVHESEALKKLIDDHKVDEYGYGSFGFDGVDDLITYREEANMLFYHTEEIRCMSRMIEEKDFKYIKEEECTDRLNEANKELEKIKESSIMLGMDIEEFIEEDLKLSEIKQLFIDKIKDEFGIDVDVSNVNFSSEELSNEC